MKRSNRKPRILGRWLSQSFVLAPFVFLLVAGAGCPSLFQSDGQRATRIRQAVVGKDGAKTVSGTTPVVVNAYTALSAGAAKGTNKITVANIADLTTGFPAALAQGDLVLIIQMTGATINSTATTAAWGAVSDLGYAGHYEFAGVEAVTVSSNQITLACGLKNDYTVSSGKAQVIRVPQYTTLTIESGASITALPWGTVPASGGTVGGVVAVHAETTLAINGTGKIDVKAKGFRGGATQPNDATANMGVTTYRSGADTDGGEKGESIAGDAVAYDALNGRYGRGAPANGGGGGDAHNAGGGGGANARAANEAAWTRQGVMLVSTDSPAAAWQCDPAYTNNTLSTSEGGGRGGYSYSTATNLDPTTQAGAPGSTAWNGDDRRSVGGLGGRPVDNNPSQHLFMGGGGGAGDGNNAVAGRGGNGGGLVFIIAGTVSGTGSIVADGENGADSPDSNAGGDAAGGGGGGGTVVIHAASLAGIAISADGGLGGSQTGTRTDTEGPGGGGGGGYVAMSGGTVTASAKGKVGGTTSHAAMAKFRANGATAGNDGRTDGDATSFLYCGALPAADMPDTTIASKPDKVSSSPQGFFTFTSNEGGVSYQCSLNNQAWADCKASYATPVLPDGHYTIAVRAIDLSGNIDPTPDTYEWDIIAGLLDGGVLDSGTEAGSVLDAQDSTPWLDVGADAGEAGAVAIDAESPDASSGDDVVVLVDAAKDDVAADLPVTGTPDTRPQPVLDGALDQQGDGLAVGLDSGQGTGDAEALLDGAAIDRFAAPIPDVGSDAAPLPDLGPDVPSANDDVAPVAQADAAVPVGNKDAAAPVPPTNEKPVLLGGGFCAVAPSGTSSPAGFALLALAAVAVLRRRRSR